MVTHYRHFHLFFLILYHLSEQNVKIVQEEFGFIIADTFLILPFERVHGIVIMEV